MAMGSFGKIIGKSKMKFMDDFFTELSRKCCIIKDEEFVRMQKYFATLYLF